MSLFESLLAWFVENSTAILHWSLMLSICGLIATICFQSIRIGRLEGWRNYFISKTDELDRAIRRNNESDK